MAKQGEEAFDAYFSEVYGKRWTAIKAGLFEKDLKVARRNLFFSDFESLDSSSLGVGEPFSFLENCFSLSDEFDLEKEGFSLLPYYRMDPASVVAARELDVQPGDEVLDMCAAPGGKTLVLLEALANAGASSFETSGTLIANELSARRRHRMMTVMKRHLPPEVRSMVKITGKDGARFGLERKEAFDRILLDAPCSGERGVVTKASDLALWKPKRTKSFGIRQYALLSSAFMALKPGGRIVYSTCSISPFENDKVIEKLEKRHGGAFSVCERSFKEIGEETKYGTQFLPDIEGWGPIYFSILQKNIER